MGSEFEDKMVVNNLISVLFKDEYDRCLLNMFEDFFLSFWMVGRGCTLRSHEQTRGAEKSTLQNRVIIQ